MPGKVHVVLAYKDKLANRNGWTVDCLQSEKTPDYRQGTGEGKADGGVTKATMYDAPSLSDSIFKFYDPASNPGGV
jgi:hypothetical protein